MNRHAFGRVHWTHVVHRLADHIQHAAQRFLAHRDGDRMTQVFNRHAANQAIGRLQSDGAHPTLADVLRHLADDVKPFRYDETLTGKAERRADDGNLAFGKFHVLVRSGHLNHFSKHSTHRSSIFFSRGQPRRLRSR